jgi:hypothetical protein
MNARKDHAMNTQSPTLFSSCCTLLAAKPEPVRASSRDYGFDFDEEEIGREMLAPLPAGIVARTVPQLEAV